MEKKNFLITEKNAGEYVKKMGLFLKNYLKETKKSGFVLGMSGGIDSSVVARLIQEAGVPVTVVLLLDRDEMFTGGGIEHARELITKFNIPFKVLSIKKACDDLEINIGEALADNARQGLRPRVRMAVLYALAQNNNLLVAGTANLDELALGYFTKWGDGACDVNLLGMLTKNEIRILARALDVPAAIIDKAPSADLFAGQTDEDDFGFTYDELDKFLLSGSSGSKTADAKIEKRMKDNAHKTVDIPVFNEK